MKSFRSRVTLRIGLVFFGLLFTIFAALNVYMVHQLGHAAKIRLKTISRSILRELDTAGVPDRGPVPPQVIRSIDEKLSWIDHDKRLAYAIVSRDYRLLANTPGFSLPQNREFLAREHQRLFLASVDSGEGAEDLFSEWRYLYRYSGENGRFIIYSSDSGQYELVERLAEGMVAVLFLALLLAIPCGYVLARMVLRPIAAIGAVASCIRKGDLSARIEVPSSQDEIAVLARDLNSAFTELEASFQRARQFSADAAHELNTPLTSLRGNLEVCLSKERSVSEYQAVLGESVTEIALLSNMVRDLLLLSAPGRNRRQHFRKLSLADTVSESIERLGPVAMEREIEIISDLDTGVIVLGDMSLLPRLSYNLLHNAIRFSHPGSSVSVVVGRMDGAAVLEVHDSGIGISRENQERIFERFHQIDSSRSTGSGLGLSIVQWIVELHSGRIGVNSELGKGSCFRVTLPAVSETVAD